MSEEIIDLKNQEKEDTNSDFSDPSPESHTGMKWDHSPILGIVLIAVGSMFLLSQLLGWQFNNWWAVFMFIPAFGALSHAFQLRAKNGRFGDEGRGSLGGGLFMLFIAAMFIFGLSWSLFWPLLLIFIGISYLMRNVID